MRVVRTVGGIVLITISVLCFVIGGALWVVMQHEGSDGAFGGAATGLSTPGNAIVVPDADALIRARAPFTGGSSTTVRIDAQTLGGTVFVGLAPTAAVQAYLGPAPFGRVTALHIGAGGALVAVQNVPGVGPPRPMAVPGGAPAAQQFWTARSSNGTLEWSTTDRRYAGLTLVIMRADAAGPVAVTAQVEVRPGWMNATTWALFTLGTIVAIVAIALLLWPPRRREIVYVVEHAQLPEIAERLGVPLRPAALAVAGGESARPGGVPISSVPLAIRGDGFTAAVAGLTIGQVTALRMAPSVPAARTEPDASTATQTDSVETGPAETGPAEPGVAEVPVETVASKIAPASKAAPETHLASPPGSASSWVGPTGGSAEIPPLFADPKTRPESLRAAMLLNPVGMSTAGSMPAPTRTNENGTYRSFGTAPPVTPAFVWSPSEPAPVD